MRRCYSTAIMARSTGKTKQRSSRSSSGTRSSSRNGHKALKNKELQDKRHASIFQDPNDHATQQQLRAYEEGLKQFQQQKFSRAKQALERVLEGPNKELPIARAPTCAFATSEFRALRSRQQNPPRIITTRE